MLLLHFNLEFEFPSITTILILIGKIGLRRDLDSTVKGGSTHIMMIKCLGTPISHVKITLKKYFNKKLRF